MFFSHTIYLPTDATTFEMLFLLFLSGKKDWVKSGRRERKTFAKMPYRFGIIIISHYYASYINLNVPQRAFLLKLVFHSLCICFSNKPIYMASFSIYEVYRELAVESVFLFNTCSYVKRYTKRRILPYFRSTYGKWQLLNI